MGRVWYVDVDSLKNYLEYTRRKRQQAQQTLSAELKQEYLARSAPRVSAPEASQSQGGPAPRPPRSFFRLTVRPVFVLLLCCSAFAFASGTPFSYRPLLATHALTGGVTPPTDVFSAAVARAGRLLSVPQLPQSAAIISFSQPASALPLISKPVEPALAVVLEPAVLALSNRFVSVEDSIAPWWSATTHLIAVNIGTRPAYPSVAAPAAGSHKSNSTAGAEIVMRARDVISPALPPHLFPTARAASGQSNNSSFAASAANAPHAVGIVLGTSTASNITATGTLTVTGNTTLAAATSTNFAITQATNALRSLMYANSASAPAFTPPQVAGNGNGAVYGAVAAPIDQLTGTKLTNVTVSGVSGLTASDIPSLSGSYLSLTGGTLTGALINSGTASSSFAGALGVGTTSPSDVLAINGPIYLADITAPNTTTNRLYSNTGSLYWAGSLIGGGSVGNWSSDGTNVWRVGGNVGSAPPRRSPRYRSPAMASLTATSPLQISRRPGR